MKQSCVSIVVAFLLASCTASLPYSTDYPLTQEVFHSRDGVFSGKVPQGWFSSTEDTLAPALVAWLIREDLSATLVVRELKLNQIAAEQIRHEGLKLLAQLTASSQEDSPAIQPKEFEMKGVKFCSYEVNSGGNLGRVVVFTAKGKFYECESRVVKGRLSADDMKHMFSVQQTVLSSLSF